MVPDLVVSGINHGYNASTDILYSGTIGAASEAALRGLPAIAISARSDRHSGEFPFLEAAAFLAEHLRQFLPLCSPEVLLNINVPPHTHGEWRVGTIGRLEYLDVVERNSTTRSTSFDASSTRVGLAYGDPGENGNKVEIGDEVTLSLRSDLPPELRQFSLDTDYHLLSEGCISVTPLAVHPVVDEQISRVLAMIQGED